MPEEPKEVSAYPEPRVSIGATAHEHCFMCDGDGWLRRRRNGKSWSDFKCIMCDCVGNVPPTPVPLKPRVTIDPDEIAPLDLDALILSLSTKLAGDRPQELYCEQYIDDGPYEVTVCGTKDCTDGPIAINWPDPIAAKRALLAALQELAKD
jgi:hypothetical protein